MSWKFPLDGPIEDWERQKAIGIIRISDKRYRWLIPPWPSLTETFEKNLRERIAYECEPVAARIARTREAKSKSSIEPKGYKPPRTANDLKNRISKGESYFARSQLDREDLSGATLMGCNFSGSSFRNANLQGTDFREATLSFADFSPYPHRDGPLPTNFLGTILSDSDLTGANLVDVVMLEFDSTFIRDIRISDRPKDHWSILRDRYTPISAYVILLFSTIYFIPVFLGLLLWSLIGRVQETHPKVIDRLADWIELFVGKPVNSCLSESCVSIKAFMGALFVSPQGLNFGLLAAVVLAYNVLRVGLTSEMAKWREGTRSVWTPKKEEIQYLWRLDRIGLIIFAGVIIPISLLTFIPILFQSVLIPVEMWPLQ